MPKYVNADSWEPYFYEHMDDAHMAAAKNALDDMPPADVVERKDLDKILEGHEEIGFEQGYSDGYAQAVEDAIEAVGINTWAGSKITQLKIVQMNGENR